MTDWSTTFAAAIVAELSNRADPVRAPAMRKYMRDQFAFLGVAGPRQKEAFRAATATAGKPSAAADLLDAARALWAMGEREYQYAACWALDRWSKLLAPGDLPALRAFVTTKSWWDTVDALAADVVGDVVARYPETAAVMDAWIEDDNLWVARTALLHQLRYKEKTDTNRLFRYCLLQAGHKDFFIRKAIGWALRQYSWTGPDAVEAFVAAHEAELAPLAKREALLVISGGRKNLPKSRRSP